MLKATDGKGRLYEAWLLLVEVREGYPWADEITARVDELLSSLQKDRAKDLISGETEARALREEAERLKDEVLRGGSLLPREKADEVMARLKGVAERSGEETLLARGIATYVATLSRSFEGGPQVGVRLDPRFPGPGVRIARVDPGTGAAIAGLLPGDVVLKFGGTALSGANDFTKAIAGRKPGEEVKVEVRRADADVVTLELLLGRRMR